jgi:aryl-alcohol dehydrogenase-like predicted oxidoreductase
VHAALDAGLTFLDTAENYFDSQAKLGKALEGRRDEVFLATKVSGADHSAERIEAALSESLRLLNTDHIDLYQLHSPQPQWPIEETMGELMKHRDAGKIRYIGISNYSAAQTREAAQYGAIHSSQPRYSLLFRESEDEVLPACLELGIGTIVYSVMAKGMLASKYKPGHQFSPDDERHHWPHFKGELFERIYAVTERLKAWANDQGRDIVQLAIAWPLANPAVTSSIVGGRTVEQVMHDARAADWVLTKRDLREIDDIQGDLRLESFKVPSWRKDA